MIGLGSGVLQAGFDVAGFEIGEVREDFRFGHVGGEQVEHVFDADAHSADARASATLRRIVGDAFEELHAQMLAPGEITRERHLLQIAARLFESRGLWSHLSYNLN